MPASDEIGWLPVRVAVEFDRGTLRPVPDYEEGAAQVAERLNPDGFVYPPSMVTYRGKEAGVELRRDSPDWKEDWDEVPNTRRPALLHRMPASHVLTVSDSFSDSPRDHEAAFLMHLAAFLFGVRLQFSDWWLDHRIPVKPTHDFIIPRECLPAAFSQAYATWQGWSSASRRLMTNVLYMNSRVPSHEWDWERFSLSYMVTDACYRIAFAEYHWRSRNHGERIHVLCDQLGIPHDETRVKPIVRLRNELFHEALWGGHQPGTGIAVQDAQQEWFLRKLNHHLIAGLLQMRTDYVREPWWSFSQHLFAVRDS